MPATAAAIKWFAIFMFIWLILFVERAERHSPPVL
jgi:hypothetical protein